MSQSPVVWWYRELVGMSMLNVVISLTCTTVTFSAYLGVTANTMMRTDLAENSTLLNIKQTKNCSNFFLWQLSFGDWTPKRRLKKLRWTTANKINTCINATVINGLIGAQLPLTCDATGETRPW
jgi:hypothetical protein